MKYLTLLLSLVVFLARPALADTSSSNEVKNMKVYENCATATMLDLFTDKEEYMVHCGEETFTDTTQITVFTRNGRLYIGLTKGVQFYLERTIPVAIRVDKGDLIRRPSAQWNNPNAYILNHTLALRLLDDLARGQRVVIKVGQETGNIRLNGSFQAVQDFKRRAGLIYQRSLTIPRQ